MYRDNTDIACRRFLYREGWLLTSLALKLALELNLADAYPKILTRALQEDDNRLEADEEDEILFRNTRVWFGIVVLEHMYVYFEQTRGKC